MPSARPTSGPCPVERPRSTVDLHPAVPPFLLTANDEGRVTALAETGVAGPGYHRFVGRVLERLSAELAIDWTDGDGATAFVDRQGAERLYLGWLGPQLAKARVRVRRGERAVPLGMPPRLKVTTEAALATVLGPRDEAWLDSAIADPRVALGMTPWWADATDGHIPPQSGPRTDVAAGPLADAGDGG